MWDQLVHETGPPITAFQDLCFYLFTFAGVPVLGGEWSYAQWLDDVNIQVSESVLGNWGFDVFQVLIEIEEELDWVHILRELLDLEYVQPFVINSLIVSELVEHSKEQVDWEQALAEVGLLALFIGLDSHGLVVLVEDQVKALGAIEAHDGIE